MAGPNKSAPAATDGGQENGSMRIDPALVRELADLLTANELTEIEVADGERRIKVRREPPAVYGAAPAAAAPAAAAAPSGAPAQAAAPAQDAVAGEAVKSPMVGTAFLAPEPGAKPFVAVGDAVKAGDTLLIVEAMKVMNPLTAPKGGVVNKILITDGQPVEFDQPLLVIG